MTPLPKLLYTISQLEGNQVILIIGVGYSKEPPIDFPLSDESTLEANRRPIDDGILANGKCLNPSDLSCLANTAIAERRKQ